MATGLRERKKEQTRIDLVRAAVDLFKEQGYETTTVDDIVERANYSRSTFFRYFGSKEDVVFGDLPGQLAAVLATLEAADPDADPWALAREAITRQVLDTAAFAPELEAECVALWFNEPSLQRRYTEMVLDGEGRLTEFFAKRMGVKPETSVECQTLAMAFIGVARAALQAHVNDEQKIADLLNRGFDLLEQGRPKR